MTIDDEIKLKIKNYKTILTEKPQKDQHYIYIGFKGPLGFYKNSKEGYITLEKPEEKPKEFKSEISKIVNGGKKSKEQISATNILKYFTNHKKKLPNYLIILELNLKLKTNQIKIWRRSQNINS